MLNSTDPILFFFPLHPNWFPIFGVAAEEQSQVFLPCTFSNNFSKPVSVEGIYLSKSWMTINQDEEQKINP